MGYETPFDLMLACRGGEESRVYLIECFEAYSERHTLDGFEAKHSDHELASIRHSVDSGARAADDASGRSKSCGAVPPLVPSEGSGTWNPCAVNLSQR